MVKNKKAFNIFSALYCAIILALIYAPIILLVIYSFNSAKIIGEEGSFSLKWYIELFQSERVIRILVNTVVLALCAAIISTALGTAGAIGIFYSGRKVNRVVQTVNQIPIVNAEIVTSAVARAPVFAHNLFKNLFFSDSRARGALHPLRRNFRTAQIKTNGQQPVRSGYGLRRVPHAGAL